MNTDAENPAIAKILFDEETIRRRVAELAQEIGADYIHHGYASDPRGRPVLLVCILRGALIFTADLARKIPMPVEYDLISVSSYRNGTAPGAVRLVQDLERPIARRDVLIVEDIIDTGYTIEYLKRNIGFPLEEDAFVVGYGMDYGELYRNLPYIGVLNPEQMK